MTISVAPRGVTRLTSRLAAAPDAFDLLVERAGRRLTITYADFADRLDLGSPRALGWLLTPLLAWCEARGFPPLPIIVVRRFDGLPSGGYGLNTVAAETERVFDFTWFRQGPPSAADITLHALASLPVSLRGPSTREEPSSC